MTSTGEGLSPMARLQRLVRELAKFGTVGAFGFLVNVAVFNLCLHSLGTAPVRAGIIATVVAIATNYLGNRYWTYRRADKQHIRRELVLFAVFSGAGLVIENGVLALSHYGLGLTSQLADNIAKNVVGLGLGTVFRFWSYRTWVFLGEPRRPDIRGRTGRPRPARSGSRPVGGLTPEKEREHRRMALK